MVLLAALLLMGWLWNDTNSFVIQRSFLSLSCPLRLTHQQLFARRVLLHQKKSITTTPEQPTEKENPPVKASDTRRNEQQSLESPREIMQVEHRKRTKVQALEDRDMKNVEETDQVEEEDEQYEDELYGEDIEVETETEKDEELMEYDLGFLEKVGDQDMWINPKFGNNITERRTFWNTKTHLAIVGRPGVTKTLVNSVYLFAKSHNFVKIRISDYRQNALNVTHQFLTMHPEKSPLLEALVDVYEVRNRGVMFRRKNQFPSKKPSRVVDDGNDSQPLRVYSGERKVKERWDRQTRLRKERKAALKPPQKAKKFGKYKGLGNGKPRQSTKKNKKPKNPKLKRRTRWSPQRKAQAKAKRNDVRV
jgi:hypothetical protein